MSLFGGVFGPGLQKQFDMVVARVGDNPHEVVRRFCSEVFLHHQFRNKVWDMHGICKEHFQRHPDAESILVHFAAICNRHTFAAQQTCITVRNGRGSPLENRLVPYRPIRGKAESLFLYEKRTSPEGTQIAHIPLYDDRTPVVDHTFDVLPNWD